MIDEVINRTQGIPSGNEESYIEMRIPGGKVGLIIGKSGETIKQLQVTILLLSISEHYLYS